MNRKIKFRAWDKINKKWHQWKPFHATDVNPENIYMQIGNEDFDLEYNQFTGLLDKNGKEIYEGDILEENSWVEWCNNCYSTQTKYEYEGRIYCHRCEGDYEIRDIIETEEIIGNRFENPELL